jgi:mxaL protein
MKKLITFLISRRDVSMLATAFLLLIIAAFKPTIPLPRNIYSYILVVDISQSMNVEDVSLNGKSTSRIAYTQAMLHQVIANMPCDTRVSIGLFAGVSIAALYNPIEVCSNYAAIQDTIDHLDWRTAWSGNSRLRDSMLTLARVLRAFPEPAQVVYFSDGEEAPKLHAFNTKDLTNFQGGNGWLFVGIGSIEGAPIPKYDEKNQLIGYWSNDSFAMQPGIAQISEANLGVRDNNVAGGTGDRFISKLQEDYLKDLSKEVSGDYVRGDSLQSILTAMKHQKPARTDIAPYGIHWILATIAALLVLITYLPKNPLQAIRKGLSAQLASGRFNIRRKK